MFNRRFFFSVPGCGWTETAENHWLTLQFAVTADPVANEGWRLATVTNFIPAVLVM